MGNTHGMGSGQAMSRLDWEMDTGQITQDLIGRGKEFGFSFEYDEVPLGNFEPTDCRDLICF